MKKWNRNLLKAIFAVEVASMLLCPYSQKMEAHEAGRAVKKEAQKERKHLERKHLIVDMGESVSLVPKNDQLVSGESSQKKVAAISKNGTIHALAHGKSRVVIRSTKGDKKYTTVYHITVKKRGMVYPTFTMMKGEHLDLQFSKIGTKAVWKSDKPSVAKVTKSGRVIARKKGKACLTGIAKDGKIYRCNLKVTKKIKSVIYLTFDDGPNRYTTPKILNILKKNHVKATFFELKPAKKDFDLSKRVVDEGHTLALHGYQHKYDIIYRSEKIYHNNLDKLRNLFFKKYGVWCTISRFPGGSSNMVSRYNPGIMTKLTKKLDKWGYHYFDWNADSCDAGGAKNSEQTYHNVTSGLLKGRGNVVLMHDFANNDKTINALDRIIQYGKKHGFVFRPITASTQEVHHGVNN